jgi:hypothetical protein
MELITDPDPKLQIISYPAGSGSTTLFASCTLCISQPLFIECAHIILGQNKLPRNFINAKDDGGWTPLVWACEHRSVR